MHWAKLILFISSSSSVVSSFFTFNSISWAPLLLCLLWLAIARPQTFIAHLCIMHVPCVTYGILPSKPLGKRGKENLAKKRRTQFLSSAAWIRLSALCMRCYANRNVMHASCAAKKTTQRKEKRVRVWLWLHHKRYLATQRKHECRFFLHSEESHWIRVFKRKKRVSALLFQLHQRQQRQLQPRQGDILGTQFNCIV